MSPSYLKVLNSTRVRRRLKSGSTRTENACRDLPWCKTGSIPRRHFVQPGRMPKVLVDSFQTRIHPGSLELPRQSRKHSRQPIGWCLRGSRLGVVLCGAWSSSRSNWPACLLVSRTVWVACLANQFSAYVNSNRCLSWLFRPRGPRFDTAGLRQSKQAPSPSVWGVVVVVVVMKFCSQGRFWKCILRRYLMGHCIVLAPWIVRQLVWVRLSG